MRMPGRYTLSSVIVLLTSVQPLAAEVLQHNPFERPMLEGRAPGGGNVNVPNGELTLRATLAAGDASLANINGELLHIGDEVSGYQVREINEGSVVLFKNEQLRRLTVRDDQD